MLLLTAALVTAIVAAVAIAGRDTDAASQLRRLRITPIAEVGDGDEVAIAGRLELAEAPLCAPLSGHACAAYSATVEYHDQRCRRCVVQESVARDFLVRDESGAAALVRAPRVLGGARSAVLRPTMTARPPSRRLRRFLRRQGLGAWPSLDGAPYADRCCETALQPNQAVAIVGVGHWEPAPAPDRSSATGGYREAPRRIVFAAATVIAGHPDGAR
jgi:hypothetical protein